MDLEELLARGYFPKELPPPFNTESFAKAVTAASPPLPGYLSLAGTTTKPRPSEFPTGHCVKYSHARGGLLRRQLSLPNPIHHFLLCYEMAKHWGQVSNACAGTELSATSPRYSKRGRAIQGKYGLADKRTLALRRRSNRRFLLATDISRFYHSIYTHSIPWAMIGKEAAKSNRRFSELCNRLDFWVRAGQDGQTVGIPIGPDTSLVFAEMLMQRCDEILADDIPRLRGWRYIDDYELSFVGRSEAEDAYHFIERALGKFELALNPKKTNVSALPAPLRDEWAPKLKKFSFSADQKQQLNDLFEYFEMAFEYDRLYAESHVLHYALARLRSLRVDPSNWADFQRFLLLCASPAPSSIPFVLEMIVEGVNAGLDIEKELLAELLNTTIVTHGELPHSSEVAWALWGAIALSVDLSREAAEAMSGCDDSIAALLALHADEEGLFAEPLDTTHWGTYMTCEGLYGPQWLLAYEASIQGWLASAGVPDHIADDEAFDFLRSGGVSFYERSKAAATSPEEPVPSAKPETFSEIIPGFY